MNKYTFEKDGKTYCRISKQTARGYYDAGVEILACPCNLRPGTIWHPEIYICREMAFPYASTFDKTIAYVTGMNCLNNETGHYLAYYVAQNMLPNVREYADYLEDRKEGV